MCFNLLPLSEWKNGGYNNSALRWQSKVILLGFISISFWNALGTRDLLWRKSILIVEYSSKSEESVLG